MVIQIKHILIVAVVVFLFGNCTYHNETEYFTDIPTDSTNLCNTANMSFQTDVYPVINANCVGCHGNSRASGRINREGYENVKKNSALMMKAIKHESGVEPMPQNAAKLADCTISKLDAWIDQGMKDN